MRKEHPILFSAPMVQAILEGRKTMTRRIIKQAKGWDENWQVRRALETPASYTMRKGTQYSLPYFKCPYGTIGHVIWVRETWTNYLGLVGGESQGQPIGYAYRADNKVLKEPNGYPYTPKWKPSIFMPRAASRILLKITGIKVERVQDISEEDIISEGIRYPVNNGHPLFKLGEENSALHFMPDGFSLNHKESIPITEKDLMFAHWAELWCEINGRESWNKNPWVWVIQFEKSKSIF